MKFYIPILLLTITAYLASCKKETFITSADAKLATSVDSLHFDTVFTTAGSVTQSFIVRNQNNQKLRISNVQLAGGAASAYKINVDGAAGTQFSNIEVNANDSFYVFVKVNINPSQANLPFIVRDSIKFDFNGNTHWVQLDAFGQNARFLRNQKISTSTTWNSQLPYVILGGLTIDTGITLTLEKGVRVYCNATAPIIVNGTLKAMGDKNAADRIIFRGDRMDADYKDFPGGWPGILFNNSSAASELNYTEVRNAYQALVVNGFAATPKLTLRETIVDNAYDLGIFAFNTNIVARNCLISNCGNDAQAGAGGSNIIIRAGGIYNFNHCTVVTYANNYQVHKQPVLYVNNSVNSTSADLVANFTSCIFWGEGGLVEDEIKTDKQGANIFSLYI